MGALSVRKISLQAKLAYYAKTRRSNFVASLRLEDYDVTRAECARDLPTREEVLRSFGKPG